MKEKLVKVCLLAIALSVASCASPDVKRLDHPVIGNTETGVLLGSGKLTGDARSLLEENGLSALYRRNAGEAISRLRDELRDGKSDAHVLALAELCSDAGADLVKTEPRKAVGYFLAAAELTFEGALKGAGKAGSPSSTIFNHSSGRVAKILFDLGETQSRPVSFQGPWKTYQLRHRTEHEPMTLGFFDELESADYVELKNFEMERYRRPGIGAAMVGHRNSTVGRRGENPFLSPVGMSISVNAMLDFQGGGDGVELRFSDALIEEAIVIRGQSLPLAADLTVPIAVQVKYDVNRNDGFKAMIHPDKFVSDTGLHLLEPFRPDLIPVIFVHGLMSEPEVWVHALNRLRADPVLAQKFQLLVYRYPTGFPVVYNIATLRKHLEAFQKHFDPRRRNPNMRRIMLVGHSMGSVIGNSVIRGSGDAFTDYLFDQPIDEIAGLDEEQRATLKDLLLYDANSDITRAVFLAGPFRGSKTATGFIGKLGRSLISLPRSLFKVLTMETLVGAEDLTEEGRALLVQHPNSITNLKPGAPVLKCILETPVRKGVAVHTIIGREDPSKPLLESSDGTVAYKSSHLDEAVSEKVVHAKHTPLCKHPDTLEELRRILYLHAGLGEPR